MSLGIDNIKEIFQRIKNRDFSGNTGLAVKNSIYQFLTNIAAKGGGFVFIIFLARMLTPETFGLYSLAMSVIMIFYGFSDLGISTTLINRVSYYLGKRNYERAKPILSYLIKIKVLLVFIVLMALFMASSKIAHFYGKPIYLALLAGMLFLISRGMVSISESISFSFNNFKATFYKEIFFQTSKLILLILAAFFIIQRSTLTEMNIFILISIVAFSYFLTFFVNMFLLKKDLNVLKKRPQIKLKNKKKINYLLIATSAMIFSGMFFGYIDSIMLGKYVLADFIGFYNIAYTLIGGITPFLTFSFVLFPIFSRLSKGRLNKGFKKTLSISIQMSVLVFIFVLIFSPMIVNILFGQKYLQSVSVLRILSLLLILIPLISLYSSYFISRGKSGTLAKLLILSTLINIGLNYLLISYLIPYGDIFAVFGVATSSVVSQFIYLSALIFFKRWV